MNVAAFKKRSRTQQLIDEIEGREPEVDGAIHHPHCFIVNTHSPHRDWKPINKPYTCHYCIRDFGVAGSR